MYRCRFPNCTCLLVDVTSSTNVCVCVVVASKPGTALGPWWSFVCGHLSVVLSGWCLAACLCTGRNGAEACSRAKAFIQRMPGVGVWVGAEFGQVSICLYIGLVEHLLCSFKSLQKVLPCVPHLPHSKVDMCTVSSSRAVVLVPWG